MNVVTLRNVRKSYGASVALKGISLEIDDGEIVALLGPNGAGKTTTLEILLGLRRLDAGAVVVCGGSPSDAVVRTAIGATPQASDFPEMLRVRELLAFVAAQYPAPADLGSTLSALGIGALADRYVGGLSGGQRRSLALALAFIGNPRLMVLDEPTTGLDVDTRRLVWKQIALASQERRTILFATHHLEEAEMLATRVVVINCGEIAFDGTPAALRQCYATRRLVYVGDPFDPSSYGLDARVTVQAGTVTVTTPDTDAAIRALVAAQVRFTSLHVVADSLETAFLAMTGGSP